MRTLGITGSSGKTSTKDLLGQVLAAAGATVSPPGSFNNDIGLPLTVLDADETTRYLVLEMGSRGPGHIARLCGVARPHVGVVLNVGSAHLGEFGSPEGIAQAKGELVEALPGRRHRRPQRRRPARARHGGADLCPRAHHRAGRRRRRPRHPGHPGRRRARPLHPRRGGEEHPVSLLVVGEHQVANALSAAGAALAAGLAPAAIAAALSSAGSRSRWRMEVDRRADGVTVVNDAYNANPESMRAALAALAGLTGERRIAVLGAMAELGPDAAAEHERLGRDAVAAGVDLVVAVGPDAVGIADGASAAGGRAGGSRCTCRTGRCPRAAVGPAPTRGRRPREGQPLLRAGAARRRSARPLGPPREVGPHRGGFGLIISILLTPLAIRAFRRQGLGQEIRDDGPESHLSKQGTPTMGGTVIVGATLGGYLAAHVFLAGQPGWGLHRHRPAAARP